MMTELKITNNITLIKVDTNTVLHVEDHRVVHCSKADITIYSILYKVSTIELSKLFN